MNRDIFQISDYTVELYRDGNVVEIYAKTMSDDGKELQSAICQVNGIASELLSDEEIEDGRLLEESFYQFDGVVRAKEVYESAHLLFNEAERDPQSAAYICGVLDEDRAEGEWSFPSDGAE